MAKKEYKFEDCRDCARHNSWHCNRCGCGERFEDKDNSLDFERDPYRAMKEMGFDYDE